MTPPLRSLAALCALALLAALSPAHAADCAARQSAGYRVLTLETGRKVAVWYPAAGAEKPFPYTRNHNGFLGRVAFDAPPAACPRVPLVLFSHGLGGCGLQTLFLTEELARHGYVVAAPDHADSATCGIEREGLRLANMRTEQAFVDPQAWNDRSEIGRLHDLRAAIGAVAADEALGRVADVSRVGAIGHSLGGYAVLGMAGGWPAWTTPQVRAVLALSPYAAPFVAHGTLGRLAAPVMYQGAQFDWGLTPAMEGPNGAYARSPAPKYFVKLAGGTHFEWTNWLCAGQPDVEACLKANRNAGLIVRYALAFLDRHLKDADKATPVLASRAAGLDQYEFALR